MKRLGLYFILLTLAVIIGLAINMHAGYVLISYSDIVIETTLWVAIFFLLCGFLLFYGLLRSSHNVYRLPRTIRKFLQRYRIAKAHRYFDKGLCKLLENDWLKAHARFAQAIATQQKNHLADVPLTTYLAAAYSANKQHLTRQRDSYLDAAQKSYHYNQKFLLAIGLVRVQLLLTNQQYEEALVLICQLRQHGFKQHKLLLRHLHTVYLQQQDWRALQTLLPLLFRHKVLPQDEFGALEQKVYCELWTTCLATGNEKKIRRFWRKLPRIFRHRATFIIAHVNYLLTANAQQHAEKLLLQALNKHWQEELVEKYGLLVGTKPWRQLKNIENWLALHPNNLPLLLAASRVCQRQMLMGKAKYYLEQYLRYAAQENAHAITIVQAYQELGAIMEKLSDQETALKYYRQGCSHAVAASDRVAT